MPTDPFPDWLNAVQDAADTLLQGGVVAYPTETVWGLAAHPQHPHAVERLYALKGRAADKPVQVSCAGLDEVRRYAPPSRALDALAPLWPGPLTLVTAAEPGCPAYLAPNGQVGLRVPDHPVALALLRLSGGALATTSCNRSGLPAARTWREAVDTGLGDLVLPDGGHPAAGIASTVLLLPGGDVIREGAVPAARIRQLLAGQTE
ncbi:SUA5-like protein [Deinococcus malanensis]|uniref:L-threonylcarbamoyladenylate synthase n=1 Tax=Deinococcus malanensis TaxID=1706855 RepID=A0ABQ2EJV2_9DEIO|nr:L-threonylcarbamoyladenylate synthase [Deinococcus malanensis]GGK13707.1 SUA5-like protein [Deinococcus malanensis]